MFDGLEMAEGNNEQLSRAKDDVIQKQAAVIETLQQIVKVQNKQIETLKKALA